MTPEIIALNHSEKLYLALEGMLGSVSQVYAVRFADPVHPHAARDAFRALVRSRPRLRTRVERTVTGHRLRVRPVDHGIERLIDHAFEVAPTGEPGPTLTSGGRLSG